jgi:hypothetical protein
VKGITTKYLTDPPTVEINAGFSIKGETEYSCDVGFGSNDNNAVRIKNAFAKIIPARLETVGSDVKRLSENLEQAQSQIDTPFEHEDEIVRLENRLAVLNARLSGIDEKHDVIADSEEIAIDVDENSEQKQKDNADNKKDVSDKSDTQDEPEKRRGRGA